MKTKSIITTRTITTVFAFLLLIAPIFVFAQIKNPLGDFTIPQLIGKFMGYIVQVGGVIATFAFVWAGFLYVQARGNPSELEKAKEVFINTCIGVAVLLGAQLISSVITETIGSLKN